MKVLKWILKIGGCVLLVVGAACLVAAYYEKLRDLLPVGRREPAEYEDFDDID